MDDLVHHCLRELSFDGDLGSNVSRLRDFIVDFYAQAEAPHGQNPDDLFCAFVWSVVVQQPTIRVGTVPEGLTSEVWIAPQTSKTKKAKERGEELGEVNPPKLDVIADAASRSLESLVEEFQDRLRVAVEPSAIFAAITGSHIRFAKLSPMVYSALQVITRGRDDGVSVVALGKLTGYDQKTCFYLIKQLQELNLVVKVPKPGIGTNFVIHRYFFDKNPHWKAIRDEEYKAEEEDKIVRDVNEEDFEEEISAEKPALDFTPIDARHLSSLPLVRSRVIKLLKASKNHIHESNNMLITVGFSNPTKTDRRFFQNRIKELIQQGVIEKVVVPSLRRKATTAMVKCFRLVTADSKPEGVILDTQDDEEAEEYEKTELAKEMSGVKMNVTLHKQIYNLLEESGTRGMTLSDISIALSNFDKRTIELLLARTDKDPPPPHLGDLGVAGVMETRGRERRHRYFTIAAYRRLVAHEKLDESASGYGQVDLASIGKFATLDENMFYRDETDRIRYEDAYKVEVVSKGNKKSTQRKNPILADGSVKLGRPRKHPPRGPFDGEIEPVDAGTKRKADWIGAPCTPISSAKKRRAKMIEDIQPESRVLKRRGRPPKVKNISTEPIAPESGAVFPLGEGASISQISSPKRKSPSKKRPIVSEPESPLRRSKRKKVFEQADAGDPPGFTGESIEEPVSVLEQEVGDARVTPMLQKKGSDGSPAQGKTILRVEDSDSPVQRVLFASQTVEENTALIDSALMRGESGGSSAPDLHSSLDVEISFSTTKATKGRVNVSSWRREAEIYRVLESFGGIAHIQSREFSSTHMALLETLTKAGEPTSAPPGTKTDKRTVMAALDSLEARGKIKQLKTSIQAHTGAHRPARIAYLPHVTEARLKELLGELARSLQPAPQPTSFVKIDKKVEYGADPTTISRSVLPLQLLQLEQPGVEKDKKERWSKNIARANQLFAYDDETIREVLLAERTTLGQSYGFIVGKIARIRELHLLLLRALECDQFSSNLISYEERIFDISFLCHDLPLNHYCSFISCLAHSKPLSDYFATEGGKQVPVRNLPPQLHSFLQIGRSRARSRFLEMLEVMRHLGVIVPLQISNSEHALITCSVEGKISLKFDRARLDTWTTSTPMVAPSFWKLETTAPVHLWCDSETDPPFWKHMPIDTVALATQYWDALKIASFDTSIGPDSTSPSGSHSPSPSNVSLARSLRRPASWNTRYILTWHQMQYLKQFVDIRSAETPLEEPDDTKREETMSTVSRITSATREAVASFFTDTRQRLLRDLNRLKQKGERSSRVTNRARHVAEVKELLAKKAAEARRQREQEWDVLLLRVHPSPLGPAASSRVRRVQRRFLEAGSTQEKEKWERDILHAIREAEVATVLKISRPVAAAAVLPRLPPPPPPPIVFNPLEPSTEDLIKRQGTPLPLNEAQKKKKRGKTKATEEESSEMTPKPSRRHRFQWNRDYDELARDAAAIIRARCRSASRVDWGAFEQVFPAVPRNTVRQRLAHIREAPGNEAYMNRLEEKWYELWIQHRGTPALPDDEPSSLTKFNLPHHIDFLRKHIDKNALRVGFSHTRETGISIIPSTIEELLEEYEVELTDAPGPIWDFMWNANVEEGREKGLMRQAFNQSLAHIPSPTEASSDGVALAEAALKMTLGTPAERYRASQGQLILASVGQKAVGEAGKSLVSRGVLSKLIRDPEKPGLGRYFKISDINLNAIGGTVPTKTLKEAVELQELVAQGDGWREWSLIASDGNCAALIELVMENKIDFSIDTSQAQAERMALDWNSKKADDDQIETSILYQRTAPANAVRLDIKIDGMSEGVVAETNSTMTPGHGFSENGEAASCKLTAKDSCIIDCAPCLGLSIMEINARSSRERLSLLRKVLTIVHNTGRDGITASMLQAVAQIQRAELLGAIEELTRTTVPLIHWTGYTSLVLVSAPYIKHWSTNISEVPLRRIFPRRWLDTEGSRIGGFWQAALKAVLGLVIFRPGISHTEIRWRLRSTYDRQEICEVTQHLLKEGFLKVRTTFREDVTQWPLDDDEERQCFYFFGDRRWYAVSVDTLKR